MVEVTVPPGMVATLAAIPTNRRVLRRSPKRARAKIWWAQLRAVLWIIVGANRPQFPKISRSQVLVINAQFAKGPFKDW
jgi:hypothetical protein